MKMDWMRDAESCVDDEVLPHICFGGKEDDGFGGEIGLVVVYLKECGVAPFRNKACGIQVPVEKVVGLVDRNSFSV